MAGYAPDYVEGVNECVHFIFADPEGLIVTTPNNGQLIPTTGLNHMIACSPEQQFMPKHATTEVVATNCPLCKQTEAYKRIELEQLGGMNDADKKALFYSLKQKQAKRELKEKEQAELKASIQADADARAAASIAAAAVSGSENS